ncbi:MAG: oligosaccharide flippase family protein [Candidatus Cloacimonetes bacterium]|nr:oligosaccharide flippase family protein [Candidatus Cloacimonadota bacterium]
MNIAKKLVSTFFLNIIIVTITFSISIIFSRVLGPENFGIYRYTLLIASTLTLFSNFGLPEMLQLKLAQNAIKLKDYLVSSLAGTMTTFFIFLFIVYYYLLNNHNSIDSKFLLAGLIFCFVFQINFIFHNAIYALDRIVKFQLFDILKQGVLLMFAVFLYFIHSLTILNILLILSFANSFSIIYILILVYKDRKSYKAKIVYTKELFKNSGKTYLNNIMTFMTYRFNVYILKFFVSFHDIGIYSLAITLSEKLWLFPESVRAVLYLELSNKRQGDIFIAKLLRLLTFFIVISSIFIFSLAYIIIPFVFSDAFYDSVLPFLILVPGVMLFCYSKLLAAYFIVKNMIIVNTYSSVTIAIVSLILNFALIPKFFIIGAAIASSIAYSIGSLFHIYKFMKTTNIHWKEILIIKKSDFKNINFLKNTV